MIVEAVPTCSGAWAIRAGEPIARPAFDRIRRRMALEFCKWDAQVGDTPTLADFPLLISRGTWHWLANTAERAAAELVAAEAELLGRRGLHRRLGVPRKLRRALACVPREAMAPAAARVMRFDFHPTADGWRVSEVNSDVPGGFTEATHFTRLVAEASAAGAPAGDPLTAWADAVCASSRGGPAALIYAPGYLEDMQVMTTLRQALADRGVDGRLAKMEQLVFEDGVAHLRTRAGLAPLGAVVRFFQAEWLARIPGRHWKGLVHGTTPAGNPISAILTESKRFGAVMSDLCTPMPTWTSLLPETRDPRAAPWDRDAAWLVKTAYCNNGDTVCGLGITPAAQWRKVVRAVRRRPGDWAAQRRFKVAPVESALGPVLPCLGVYTVNGAARGAYGRMSTTSVVDYAAADAAVLVEP